MDSIKIFFLTYCYPPQKYPRSIQISHLVQYLRKKFSLEVITSRPETIGDQSLLSFTPLDNVYYAEKSRITRFLEKSKGDRFKKAILPDFYYPWHIDLYRKTCNIIKQSSADMIVTFGQPMSTHITGLKLKKKFPYLKWLAHFSDPWVNNIFNEYSGLTKCINKYYQDKVFNSADNLIFTSQETIDLVTKCYSSLIVDKTFYIPHCFNASLYSSEKSLKVEKLFIIRYLGNFYGERQPGCLFEALQKIPQNFLKGVRIEIVGPSTIDIAQQIKFYDLENTVFIVHSVNYLDSLKLMRESDLLLIIDAPTDKSPFLPSKLIDYIGANKPIFGITPPGTSQILIEAMGFLVANPRNTGEISTKLSNMIEKIRAQKTLTIPHNIRNQYSIETVGQKIDDIFRKACTSF